MVFSCLFCFVLFFRYSLYGLLGDGGAHTKSEVFGQVFSLSGKYIMLSSRSLDL